jgi:cell division protein FtsZ
LIEDPSIKRASGLIISITGGKDLTLFEIEEAASRIREEVDPNANIIVGATFDDSLEDIVRVSVVATGIDNLAPTRERQPADSLEELVVRLRNDNRRLADRIERHAAPPQLTSPLLRPAAPRGLDRSARSPAGRNAIEDKILDIPAFLGRKAN